MIPPEILRAATIYCQLSNTDPEAICPRPPGGMNRKTTRNVDVAAISLLNFLKCQKALMQASVEMHHADVVARAEADAAATTYEEIDIASLPDPLVVLR
jgi:hypothetical protein